MTVQEDFNKMASLSQPIRILDTDKNSDNVTLQIDIDDFITIASEDKSRVFFAEKKFSEEDFIYKKRLESRDIDVDTSPVLIERLRQEKVKARLDEDFPDLADYRRYLGEVAAIAFIQHASHMIITTVSEESWYREYKDKQAEIIKNLE